MAQSDKPCEECHNLRRHEDYPDEWIMYVHEVRKGRSATCQYCHTDNWNWVWRILGKSNGQRTAN